MNSLFPRYEELEFEDMIYIILFEDMIAIFRGPDCAEKRAVHSNNVRHS